VNQSFSGRQRDQTAALAAMFVAQRVGQRHRGSLGTVDERGGSYVRAGGRVSSARKAAWAAPGHSSLKEIAGAAAAEAEQQAIRRALETTMGNKSEAARLLRTDYKTLHLKMKQYGVDARRFRAVT